MYQRPHGMAICFNAFTTIQQTNIAAQKVIHDEFYGLFSVSRATKLSDENFGTPTTGSVGLIEC